MNDGVRNIRVPGFTADEVSIQIKLNELRIVVQHLLEMWYEPLSVD